MDWKTRKYYIVSFIPEAYEMRMGYLQLIPKLNSTHIKIFQNKMTKWNNVVFIR